ncbi:MAG: thioredoxin-dependent thiol peroxidase [Pseudomonadota bacterium]|nr:thioredoxin-dependent thiol peroxidase [Pseudomonadota bacterium]
MSVDVGSAAPDFTLPADDGTTISLSSLKGNAVVLYFYPKDDTPGCTAEACAFRDSFPDFSGADAKILGISKDSPASHKKFREKYGLNFPLLSDEKSDACERYGAWKEKSMYGKKYMGIDRSTFLIDRTGKIHRVWKNVKVDDHAAEVLEAVRGLKRL